MYKTEGQEKPFFDAVKDQCVAACDQLEADGVCVSCAEKGDDKPFFNPMTKKCVETCPTGLEPDEVESKPATEGTSLFAGIVSRGPTAVYALYSGIKAWATGTGTNALHPLGVVGIIVGMLLMMVFVVFITLAERRLPVQYAKRVVGRKMMGGQSTHIPMKVNMSGVLPIIFAQTIASIPATIAAFVPKWQNSWFMRVFDTSGVVYCIFYFLLIIGFSYFYATIQFNPMEVANNLKKQGGFIPGFRPGRPTADFISKVLNKITLFGAIYLSIVAILPIVTGNIIGMRTLAIGGTSVLIVVSVALETQKDLEAQMMMRHYKGFLE